MKRKERIQAFVGIIWQWYESHKRSLPWRDLTDPDPTDRAYKILVSEIMLQQTQVPRVIVTYRNFLERFPRLSDLATASNRDVLIAWRGMGYNSRALRLRDAARKIIENGKLKIENNDIFPSSMEALMSIPGIGHYTAAAVRNFAFGLPTPCIDTNIRRILHRTFVGPERADGSWEKDDEYLLEIAGEVLKEAECNRGNRRVRRNRGSSVSLVASVSSVASDWHAALMDFGSLVQTKRNPKWEICPLTKNSIMKATPKNIPQAIQPSNHVTISRKQEPGRFVGSTFIPNRIFRGKVVDLLRDAPSALSIDQIGRCISVDWDRVTHRAWLKGLLQKLLADQLVRKERGRYVLG